MKQVRIVAVGRIKTPHWLAAIDFYRKRIATPMRLDEKVVKDADPSLPMAKRLEKEAERLEALCRFGEETVVCLDERGKNMTSPAFAAWLTTLWDADRPPVFIIGGAFGIGPSLKAKTTHSLSFGAMTLPHELARVVLYEQLYRAESILSGSGYHHE
ncbi:23S rRNA (pseudouridine(1915)-N(3))-methyltransferase RlmH [Desulfovibrio cuneatus]|uniref:23S rRNA (pseudouridine(1915)-N(3))-methyltransferase RlmH n=1 Tax=Desulfovibrio cuneatus TaxID=159728 RepID=UPI000482D52D|nr:23S rRNA (pseudouridine(1915)-N(3))-methyltransferase RlmH [Desulfovibrio cuneatus]